MNDTSTIKIVGTVSKEVEQFSKMSGELIDLWVFTVNVLQQDKWDPNTQQFTKTIAPWQIYVKKEKLPWVDGLRRGDRIEVLGTAKIRMRRANDGREFANYSFFLDAAWVQKAQHSQNQPVQNQNPDNLGDSDIPF